MKIGCSVTSPDTGMAAARPGHGEDDPAAAIAELQSAVRARDEFISMIVHEIRNPLTPLLMQTNSLLLLTQGNDAIPEKISRGVRMLNVIVEQLLRRTTLLLDTSRMSSGVYKPDISKVNASVLFAEVVERMMLEATAAGSTLNCSLAKNIVGHWDALALEQIADNLISNAIKYGEGRSIDISCLEIGNTLELRVTDRGQGISQENLARVFERFERAVSRGQASGFGVGLWVVGRLVAGMNGKIEINSDVGAGTTFVVTLPNNSGDTHDGAHRPID